MKFLQKRQNERSFTKSDYVVLSYEQLLQVNGAGGSSSGGGGPSGPSGNLTDSGYPSSTDLNTGKAPENIKPTYTNQKDFSDTYGANFGSNACAATSLLNEISEQYTIETGKALTEQQVDAAMAAAVNSGSVSSTNAWVSDWTGAANAMADAVGLEGNYTYKK